MKKYINAIKKYSKDATTSDAKTGACWEGYERVPNTKKGEPNSCRKIGSTAKADLKESWDEEWTEHILKQQNTKEEK
jgi:hypothetical protein